MNAEQQEAYNEGYRAFTNDIDESACPYETGYVGALGEYWCDGWADAQEDLAEAG